jgi:hypothetical protein
MIGFLEHLRCSKPSSSIAKLEAVWFGMELGEMGDLRPGELSHSVKIPNMIGLLDEGERK